MSYNRDMPTGNCQKCINTFGTLGCCDTISNEWRYNCDDGMRLFDERKPQTNADRIRAMTDEDLATFLSEATSNAIVILGIGSGKRSKSAFDWYGWLKAPVEGEP